MMTKEGSTKIVNFMTPRTGVLVLGRGQISHIVKNALFLKNLILYSQAQNRQTKYIVMMTKEGSSKIVDFITPGQGFFARVRPYKSYCEKCIISLKNFSYILGHDSDKLSAWL